MSTDTAFKTNYEGSIVLEKLATNTDCSVEQFLEDSVLSVMICAQVVRNNRAQGKTGPTLLLFEVEDRDGFETYDLMERLKPATESADEVDQQFPVTDPFADDPVAIDMPLSPETIENLDYLSTQLGVQTHRILEVGIDLRWILHQARQKSLAVIAETHVEDEYLSFPTTFTD